MEKKVFKFNFRGKEISVENGALAKQADGAVLVRYGDTQVLAAAVMSKNASTADFFPLTINYLEKLYSVGKIPGGFIKREGRPTEQATLASRLIDRPIRPLFADGFRNEVQVVAMPLSVDQDSTVEMTALLASSLSLMVSDIPFDGPVAGVVVGRVDGKFIINPSAEELEKTDITLSVAGTKDAINMVESGSKEVSEEDMIEALMFGHEAIKELCQFEEEITKEIGKEKISVELKTLDEELVKEVNDFACSKMCEAIQIKDKLEKYAQIDKVKEDTVNEFAVRYQDKPEEELEVLLKDVKTIVDNIEGEEVRRLITEEHIRPDGRKMDEIRDLHAEVDLLARTHGSALFTRGQTQVLSITTLGALGEHQVLDGLGIEDEKRFMHHYNFPAFSVGETGRYGSPGRREIGHGALGERALSQVIPSEEEFPYTIRVVSEVLESNGSSSQASICAGCMSLMAAGVPIKTPVAGIAMGLITEPRKELSKYAPKIETIRINPEKIKDVIGRGGETITKIILECSNVTAVNDKNAVKVDLEDDGRVLIYHTDPEIIRKTKEMIENVAREVEFGKVYNVKVTEITDFGAFVEVWPGCEGLIHISQLDTSRVEKVSDVVKVGDEILAVATGYDKKGKLNLSRKELLKEQEARKTNKD